MLLGDTTLIFAIMPVVASLIVLFNKKIIQSIFGKIVISVMIFLGCLATLESVHEDSQNLSWGIWLYVVTLICLSWQVMGFWSKMDTTFNERISISINLLVPIIFGGLLLYLWEMLTVGMQVPQVLLPPPSMIGLAIINSLEMLWQDFQQTFLKAVLAGFFSGCSVGFVVAHNGSQHQNGLS